MTRINSRAKGKTGELEFARLIEQRTGVKLTRNLTQTRQGGHDLIVSGGPAALAQFLGQFAVEVKRAKTAPPAIRAAWWDQTCKQAERAGLVPLLAHRRDREGWLIAIPLAAFSGRHEHVGPCELALDNFLEWAWAQAEPPPD